MKIMYFFVYPHQFRKKYNKEIRLSLYNYIKIIPYLYEYYYGEKWLL